MSEVWMEIPVKINSKFPILSFGINKILLWFPKFDPSIISFSNVRIEGNLLHQMQNVETYSLHSNLSTSASKIWELWKKQVHKFVPSITSLAAIKIGWNHFQKMQNFKTHNTHSNSSVSDVRPWCEMPRSNPSFDN